MSALPWLKPSKRGAALAVVLAPRSSRNSIVGTQGDRLKIAISAPPVDGRANDALVRFLSDALDLPKSAITISKGLQARQKIVEILTPFEVCEARLLKLLAPMVKT